MTTAHRQEIVANLERTEQSIQAPKALAIEGFYDFAASRAYYAAFYGATAILLRVHFSSGATYLDRDLSGLPNLTGLPLI